jgi:hypothetical protein
MSTQLHAQLFLIGGGVGLWRGGTHSQGLEGFGSAVFSLRAGLGNGAFQNAAVFAGECCFH